MEQQDKNLGLPQNSQQQEPNESQKQEQPKSIKKEIFSWVKLIALAVLLAFFINNVIIVNASVPTGSMRATIMEGTRLIGFRLSYVFSEPERFDVIVFRSPDGTDILYVKRIVGLPGERIDIVNGEVFINESLIPLDEWYLYEPPSGLSLITQSFIIPENSFFVMGDHRNDSKDSRGLGGDPWQNLFIPRGNIIGRAAFSYFPFSQIGSIR
jgi:signal peptidase I